MGIDIWNRIGILIGNSIGIEMRIRREIYMRIGKGMGIGILD